MEAREQQTKDADDTAVYKLVPEIYFSKDFQLEKDDVFKQSIAQSIENQEETSGHLQKYLDAIEEKISEDELAQPLRDLFDPNLTPTLTS